MGFASWAFKNWLFRVFFIKPFGDNKAFVDPFITIPDDRYRRQARPFKGRFIGESNRLAFITEALMGKDKLDTPNKRAETNIRIRTAKFKGK